MKLGQMPLVIQFNKRDLPDVRTDAEITELAQRGKEPVFRAIAMSGVRRPRDPFRAPPPHLGSLEAEHQLSSKFRLEAKTVLAQVPTSSGASVGGRFAAARASAARSTC